MPPRKKARLESQAASPPSVETPATEDKAPDGFTDQAPELDPDLWTDEQEIALFKGIIKWKPVGMHKHYRMIALSNHIRNHGHREPHTRPKGIWRKLDSLYNLKTLDEREDAFGDVETDDLESITERFCEFKLPEEDFADMLYERRFEKNKSSSPGVLSGTVEGRASTVEDTEEPRSSPASSFRGGRGSRRGGRFSKAARGRSKLQTESTPQRRAKASPEPSADEKDEEEDESQEEEEDDEDDEEEESEEEERGVNDAPTARGTRSRGRGRGRGVRAGRRGRRRG